MRRLRLSLFGLVVAVTLARAEETAPTFERDVRPIFKANCFQCHGEEEEKAAGLDLRLVRLMLAGGESGPALVAHDPNASLLWQMIEADEMPKGSKKLSAAQKGTIRRWLESGATTARPEPADPAEARYTPEELSHWAFQPLRESATPTEGESIDGWLLAKLHARGLAGFQPLADKRTLIRRLSFDLTGLPPTPEEVEAFLADDSPGAYAAQVERLLASHRYGERWGRHWLDLAGYAETDGNPMADRARPHAWKYRDYVVRSLNADKPFDRFVQEQLAGDELAPHPLDTNDLATVELLTATGFLRMAPDVTDTSESLADRNQAVADAIKVVGTSLLGMTIGCAQCHDHRYDPISQVDYYRLRAIFDPGFDLSAWKNPSSRVIDVTSAEARAQAEAIEKDVLAKLADIQARRVRRAQEIYDLELSKVAESDREALLAALATEEAKRSPETQALLLKYPAVKSVEFITGFLVEYDNPAFQKFEEEEKTAQKLRETKPPTDLRMVVDETPNSAAPSQVFFRGDPGQPKQAVLPGEPPVLAQHRKSAEIPAKTPGLETSGRRLAWARQLTDGTHPLVARVIVNRVWKLHFGKGLVDTPGDFGLNGDRPSHPELLDWLARSFMEQGWSLKWLHRQLVLSEAYRQRSARTEELDQIDPDNRLLGRMSIRRLEAEEVRDALLAVAGVLHDLPYGPSVPVTQDMDGAGVIGKRALNSFGKPEGPLERVPPEQEHRRSLYLAAQRTMPMTMLEAFDLPVMNPNCDFRKCSTVPTQSLLFLNDQGVIERADNLAARLLREAPTTEARIRRVYALLYGVEPTPQELTICTEFLAREVARPVGEGESAEQRALASLGQVLLAANRFIYID